MRRLTSALLSHSAIAAYVFGATIAWAQPGPPVPRPGDVPLPTPTPGATDFLLPRLDLSRSKAAPRLDESISVFVAGYRFVGNTVVTDHELLDIAAEFTGRTVSATELEALRQRLSAAYVSRGFVNSGAVYPDQDLADGIVEVRLVEGRLTDVRIGDVGRLPERYVGGFLEFDDLPLNVTSVERRLQVLRRDPRIAGVQAELRPGLAAGAGVLALSVDEAPRWRFRADVANSRSPSVGEHRLGLSAETYNLSGWGDSLALELGVTEGLEDFRARYAVPLGRPWLEAFAGFSGSETDIVEAPFDDLDITGRTTSWQLGIAGTVLDFPVGEFSYGFWVDRRDSRNWLLDEPFSFSEGARDGESRVTAFRAQQEWRWADQRQAVRIRSLFSAGFDAFGATVNDGVEDGKFFAWLGQGVWARRLWRDQLEAIVKVNAQFANDSLLPLEQFALGGDYSVRGYRQNQIVRDRGVNGSVELRRSILKNLEGRALVQLAVFFDYGRGWNRSRGAADAETLSSLGLGVLFNIQDRYAGHLYWADDLESLEDPEDRGWQDRGWHFRFRYEL